MEVSITPEFGTMILPNMILPPPSGWTDAATRIRQHGGNCRFAFLRLFAANPQSVSEKGWKC
jgi:hypothetical protein